MKDFQMTDSSIPAADAAIHEARSEVSRLVREVRNFQDKIEAKMTAQNDRITLLDRKSAQRPAIDAAAAASTPHRKALAGYLRTGDETGLRALAVEAKNYTAGAMSEGGYLVDQETAQRIGSIVRTGGSLRSVANVVQVEGGAYEVLVDRGDIGSEWIAETATPVESGSGQLDKIVIPLHELAAMPRASQRLLDDSAFDIESWIAERIAEKFGRAENAAFATGDGVDKPTGFLNYPQAPVATAEWGALGYVVTGQDGAFNPVDPADALVDLVYSLGAAYRAGAVFAMNSRTAGAVRRMKDAEGRFLWTESVAGGEPSRLLGYPVLTVEDMPDIAPGSASIAFGNFRAGYTIAERPDVRILRDPFTAKPNVQFFARARVGGAVTDFAAIRLLRFSAA
jgi:HK97 family phage major capsid protein